MSRYDLKMRLESQFSRRNCQMFLTGLRSHGEWIAARSQAE